jgi:hypothetical protein
MDRGGFGTLDVEPGRGELGPVGWLDRNQVGARRLE